MRHYVGVKLIPCIPLLFAAAATADDAADRAAIGRTIAALSETPQRAALFSQGADAARELERLGRVGTPDLPTVTISHEPWGEATIDFLCLQRIVTRLGSGAIRFITSDVALADGVWTYGEDGKTHTAPLLFVMKKEAGNWKIVSIRILLE